MLPAAFFNTLQRELVNIVQEAGLVLGPNNDAQVLAAIQSLFGSGRLLNVKTSTSSGVYTPTIGTTHIEILLIGSGGGGAAATTSTTAATGAGGNADSWLRAALITGFSGVTVTIGASWSWW